MTVKLRRARVKGAEGAFTLADIDAIYVAQEGECVYCSVPLGNEFDIDHKVPITRGGSNWPANLQLLCPICNRKKHAMTETEFLRRLAAKEAA